MASHPSSEGELFFLTDSAYLSLIDEDIESTQPSDGRQRYDGLFLERLDSFIEGQMRDMAAFANREQHSLGEIRKLVAVPHAKFLFSAQNNTTNENVNSPTIRSTLAHLSMTLQTLHTTAGLHSLLLVVAPTPDAPSPATQTEASWIGGTELGKDFWMGLKGGGVAGARAFRAKCRADTSVPNSVHPRSGDIKTELNAAVRHALRKASGNPSAEMRWTRPEILEETYGVRLRGWPTGILRRNPSNNTMRENQRLLECIRSGSMRFVSRGGVQSDDASQESGTGSTKEKCLNVGEPRGENHSQHATLPVTSVSSPPTIVNPSSSSMHHKAHVPPYTVTAPLRPLRAEASKRPAESEDKRDRHIRHRSNADPG